MLRDGYRNFELLDLLFDLVDKAGSARAIHNAMIESERQGNDFGRLTLLTIANSLVMRRSHKESSD